MPSSESRQLAYRPNHTQTDFTARQIESPVDSEPKEIVACGVDLVQIVQRFTIALYLITQQIKG